MIIIMIYGMLFMFYKKASWKIFLIVNLTKNKNIKKTLDKP